MTSKWKKCVFISTRVCTDTRTLSLLLKMLDNKGKRSSWHADFNLHKYLPNSNYNKEKQNRGCSALLLLKFPVWGGGSLPSVGGILTDKKLSLTFSGGLLLTGQNQWPANSVSLSLNKKTRGVKKKKLIDCLLCTKHAKYFIYIDSFNSVTTLQDR